VGGSEGAEGDQKGEAPVHGPGFLPMEAAIRYYVDFLSTTDVGRLVPDEQDAGGPASGWDLREEAWG